MDDWRQARVRLTYADYTYDYLSFDTVFDARLFVHMIPYAQLMLGELCDVRRAVVVPLDVGAN